MSADPNFHERLIRRSEVLALVGVSYPTLWDWMRNGKFPRSVEVGGGVAWLQSEIDEWLNSLPRRRLKGDPADPSSSKVTS